MDILIKNMELPPVGKQICLWVMHNGTVWHEEARDMIPTKMEAIPVPEHGRLIDANVAYDKIAEQEGGYYLDMDAVDLGLQETPTVLEANR